MSLKTQSVIISKDNFTLSKAKQWIKKNKYKLTYYGKGVDIKPNTYRFRQDAPKHFNSKTYITKDLKNGIKLVLGKLVTKKKIKKKEGKVKKFKNN